MSQHRIDPVHDAVMRHSLPDVARAIEQGGDVDARDREGRTPLFYVAGDGAAAIATELLRRGADPNAQDEGLETPLHFAARAGHVDVVELLLQNGATVDVQDAHGNTALFRAVFESRGRGDVIKLLLSHSADRTLTNHHGVSPVDLARSIANYDVAQFLAY